MKDSIFGYSFEDISRAQQGGRLCRAIDLNNPTTNQVRDGDRALLAEHGAQGLRDRGFFGTIDRLETAGLM